jgi:hypothetical protein
MLKNYELNKKLDDNINHTEILMDEKSNELNKK